MFRSLRIIEPDEVRILSKFIIVTLVLVTLPFSIGQVRCRILSHLSFRVLLYLMLLNGTLKRNFLIKFKLRNPLILSPVEPILASPCLGFFIFSSSRCLSLSCISFVYLYRDHRGNQSTVRLFCAVHTSCFLFVCFILL